MDFTDKVCIVTGGSRGIGKSITEALLKKGAKVLFVDVLYKVWTPASGFWNIKFAPFRLLCCLCSKKRPRADLETSRVRKCSKMLTLAGATKGILRIS